MQRRCVQLLALVGILSLITCSAGCRQAPHSDELPPISIQKSVVDGPGTVGLVAAGQPVKGVVVYFHGMDETATTTQSDAKHKSVVDALLRSGYAVVSADAAGNAFGNPASRAAYQSLIRAAQVKYQAPVQFFLATSMGALPALALLRNPEGRQIKGMVGISPLMGIPPEGRDINFIRAAWGGTVPTEADPLSWLPAAFAGKHFELFYSDGDTVVPPKASAPAFIGRFGAVADVRVVTCTGNHVAPDCFRAGDVAAWMGSLG